MSSADNQISRGGTLYRILERRFPAHRSTQGLLNVPKLAKDAGLSHETLYRAVRGKKNQGFPHGKLTVAVTVALLKTSEKCACEHSGGRLYIEELMPFVIPNFDYYTDPASLLD